MKYTPCAFSTADDIYVPAAAASLLSIRQWQPDISLYIISRYLSRKSKKLLEKYRINYIEVNLDNMFTQTWEYPIECYYLFAGPELLHEEGFTHSIYIDGDIYCNADPTRPLKEVDVFAGVMHGSIKSILGSDYSRITNIWNNKTPENTLRLQTGVLYFNNSELVQHQFLHKVTELYRKAIAEGVPRKGDDSLFALFQYVYRQFQYKQLPKTFNFITESDAEESNDWLTRHETLINEAVFYHFTGHPKPWSSNETYPDYTYKYFVQKWRHRLIDSFQTKDLRRYFPDIYALLGREHVRFYWYPSDNVGDLVTPYFLQKVCKVNKLPEYSLSEEEIMAIESSASVAKKHTLFQKKHHAQNKARYCVSTGSVIRLCGDKALVFGSGIRSQEQEVHQSFVRSVRGPLTRQRFIEEGFECPPIYGDPALLLPRFYTPQTTKAYKLGIIPHFTEYSKVKELYEESSDILVINLGTANIEEVLDHINSCETTVSSSLHGLVFSHAYRIPTRRIIFSEQIFGDGTKFADYYGGIELTPLSPIKANGFQKIAPITLIEAEKETMGAFNDTRLFDSMFFDTQGFRRSVEYPF